MQNRNGASHVCLTSDEEPPEEVLVRGEHVLVLLTLFRSQGSKDYTLEELKDYDQAHHKASCKGC